MHKNYFTQLLIFFITIILVSDLSACGKLVITIINESNGLYSARLRGLIFTENNTKISISLSASNKVTQRTEVGTFSISSNKDKILEKFIIPMSFKDHENGLITIQAILKKSSENFWKPSFINLLELGNYNRESTVKTYIFPKDSKNLMLFILPDGKINGITLMN